jgi:hypothetical protein
MSTNIKTGNVRFDLQPLVGADGNIDNILKGIAFPIMMRA